MWELWLAIPGAVLALIGVMGAVYKVISAQVRQTVLLERINKELHPNGTGLHDQVVGFHERLDEHITHDQELMDRLDDRLGNFESYFHQRWHQIVNQIAPLGVYAKLVEKLLLEHDDEKHNRRKDD